MGNGNKISKDKIGTLKGWIVDENTNATTRIELGSVTVSSGAKFNLLSLTALMRLGWQLHGNKTSLILRKGNKQIKFQHQIKTEKGLLFVLRIKWDIKDEMANPSINEITEVPNKEKVSLCLPKASYIPPLPFIPLPTAPR